MNYYNPIDKTAEQFAIAQIETLLGRELSVSELAMVGIAIHHYHHNKK
jgi:hypothetical protein